jgi:hypothetical protein
MQGPTFRSAPFYWFPGLPFMKWHVLASAANCLLR